MKISQDGRYRSFDQKLKGARRVTAVRMVGIPRESPQQTAKGIRIPTFI
jgi:hypothetical protein